MVHQPSSSPMLVHPQGQGSHPLTGSLSYPLHHLVAPNSAKPPYMYVAIWRRSVGSR